jgi:hypothetical protein
MDRLAARRDVQRNNPIIDMCVYQRMQLLSACWAGDKLKNSTEFKDQ